MPRMTRTLVAFCFAALCSVPAQAAVITYSDIFDPADQRFGNKKQSSAECTGVNDPATPTAPGGTTTDAVTGQDAEGECKSLAFNMTLVGYTNPPDELQSATLYLYFYDDTDPGKGNPESVVVDLDFGDDQFTYHIISNSTSLNPDEVIRDVVGLLADGSLSVLLSRALQGAGQADFFFAYAELDASWLRDGGCEENNTCEPPDPSVPEPASVLLFGTALAAGVIQRRRSSRNSK